MPRLPAALRRCVIVFLLGGMLAGAHVTFARAQGGSTAGEPAETISENCC